MTFDEWNAREISRISGQEGMLISVKVKKARSSYFTRLSYWDAYQAAALAEGWEAEQEIFA